MIEYLKLYGAIGLVIGFGLYFFQHQRPSQFAKDIQKIFQEERPWHYKLRERLVIPGAILLIAVCWPIAIYMTIEDLIKKKMKHLENEVEYPFIARKEFLLEECNIEQIEAQHIYVDPQGATPKLPFGHLNRAWVDFLSTKESSDKLRKFTSPKDTPYGEYGDLLEKDVQGYALVRNGEIISEFISECY
jgi:hypothetical protein